MFNNFDIFSNDYKVNAILFNDDFWKQEFPIEVKCY